MAHISKVFHILLPLLFLIPSSFSFTSPSPSNTTTVHQGIDEHDWSTTVHKGNILYQKLQSGCFPDKRDPVTLTQLEARGWTFSEVTRSGSSSWPPGLSSWEGFSKSVVMKMGWSLSKDYFINGIEHRNG